MGFVLATLVAICVGVIAALALPAGSVLRVIGGVLAFFNGFMIGRFSIPLLVSHLRDRLTEDEKLWFAGGGRWFYGVVAVQAVSTVTSVFRDHLIAFATVAFAVVTATVAIVYE